MRRYDYMEREDYEDLAQSLLTKARHLMAGWAISLCEEVASGPSWTRDEWGDDHCKSDLDSLMALKNTYFLQLIA